MLCRFLNRANVVVCPTAAASKPLKERDLAKDIKIISYGIDVDRFRSADGTNKKSFYDIPDTKIILSVGRLDPEKNVDLIIRALPEIRKHLDVHFVIIGEGTREAQLKMLTEKLRLTEHITFTGKIPNDEIPEMYALGDCFVIAGESETLGIVTLEAMAAGLPVVAADSLALPEIVKDGVNGHLFPPRDVHAIAAGVVDILSDEKRYRDMSEKSLHTAKEHSFDKTAASFETLYASLV